MTIVRDNKGQIQVNIQNHYSYRQNKNDET